MPVRLLSTISWFFLASLLFACAGNETTQAAPDGGPGTDAPMSFVPDSGRPDSTSAPLDSTVPSPDSSAGDSSIDLGDTNIDFGDTEIPPVDAGPPPPGVLVSMGPNLRLWGVTDDGYAIYSTPNPGGVLYAVRLAEASGGDGGSDAGHDAASHDAASDAASDGSSAADTGAPGAPISITTVDGSPIIVVEHDVVLVWAGFNFISGVGSLSEWTAAGGMHTLSMASVPGNVQVTPFGTSLTTDPTQPALSVGVSADSAYVLFLDNATPQGNGTADVYEAPTSTGVKAKVIAGVSIAFAYPSLGFAGGPPSQMFGVVSASTAGLQYGIHTFSVPSWTPAQSVPTTSTWRWSADNAGTKLLAFPSPTGADGGTGGAVVFPLEPDAGSATTIDPTGTFGVMTADGNDVIYGTTAGGLMRSPVASPSPTALVAAPASPIAAVLGLSPSDGTVLFFEQIGNNQGATDLYAASAVASGPIDTLSSAATAALLSPGDSFTTDSTHAIYWTGYTPPNPPFMTGPPTGTLTASATAAGDGGAPVTLGAAAVMGWATKGAKVVFDDNLAAAGTADIEAIDLATGAMPTKLVPQASPYFFLSPARDLVVYSWSVSPTLAGVYAMPAP